MESRTKNSIRNLIFGFMYRIIAMLLTFITRTVMLQVLGSEYIGLNSLFISILQVLSLSELGIGTTIIYSMYRQIAKKDNEKVNQLLNYYKKCYRVIGMVIIVIGIMLLPFLDNLIAGEYPNNINIYYIYIIYLINTSLSYFLFSYKSSLLIADQRNDINSKTSLILIIIQNVIQILILKLLKDYYYYIIILPIITIINNLIISAIVNKKYPQYKAKGKIEPDENKIIKKNIKGMFIHQIGKVVLSNVDNIVISAFLGLTILGIYNNYYYIITALFGILKIIMDSLKASVGNSIVLESKEKNHRDFIKFNFLYVWLISWMSICLLCLMQNFIELWLGKDYLLENSIIILFAIYFFTHRWCDMILIYQEARGIWWENRYVPLIAAIVNVILNLALINIIGLHGVIISTIVSVIFIYNIGYGIIFFKVYFEINGEFKKYVFRQIKYLLATIIVSVITYAICSIIKNISIFTFIIKVIMVTIIPNVLFLILYMKSNEFKEIFKFFKSKLAMKRTI